MPSCTVCTHPKSQNIALALATGRSERSIAEQYSLVPSSIHRHKVNHLSDFIKTVLEQNLEVLEAAFGEVLESARDDLKCELWAGRSAARNDILKIIRLTETKEPPAVQQVDVNVTADLRAKAVELLDKLIQARGLTREQALEILRERAPTLYGYLMPVDAAEDDSVQEAGGGMM